MSKEYYVYTLAYPDGKVFYVGKGKGNRIHIHEEYARQSDNLMVDYHRNARKCAAIREVWSRGEQIIKSILFTTDVELDAYAYEWALIHMIYGPDNLTNRNNSGRTKPGTTFNQPRVMQQERLYLTGKEAAAYLKICRVTFRRNVQGKIPEFKHGALRRIYYRQSDLNQFRGIQQVENKQN